MTKFIGKSYRAKALKKKRGMKRYSGFRPCWKERHSKFGCTGGAQGAAQEGKCLAHEGTKSFANYTMVSGKLFRIEGQKGQGGIGQQLEK